MAPNHHPFTVDFPIHQRGWTFQEYLIASRLLVFGYLEPFYLCKLDDGMSLEHTCISYNWGTIKPRRFMNNVYHNGATRTLHDGAPETLFFGLIHQWPSVLYQYTRREFGFAQDRPHAIKDVIDFMCRSFQTTCHFGIFESWPMDCLLWKTSYERSSAPVHRIPSWSWMAVTGAVDLWHINTAWKSEAVATWDPSLEDHSFLRLECRILQGQQTLDSDPDLQFMDNWPDVLEGDESTGYWADRYPMHSPDYLHFVRLSSVQNLFNLVMVVVQQQPGMYRRCGLAELTRSDRWNSVQLETVTVM